MQEIVGRPECSWDWRYPGSQGCRICSVSSGANASRRGPVAKAGTPLKDRGGSQGTTDQGNRLLGPIGAADLQSQEQAGKPNARLNSSEARRRADDLQGRLQKRMDEIQRERQLSPLPPVVLGGVLVVPAGLLRKMVGSVGVSVATRDTQAAAARARAAVMDVERSLGFEPVDREFDKLGYDVESRVPGTGKLRFIEVKGGFRVRRR